MRACDPIRFHLTQAREARHLKGNLRQRQRIQRDLVRRWVIWDSRMPGRITTYDYALSVREIEA